MSSTFWEDFKKTLKDGVVIAADKTEEYTKIGKLRVEIINQNRTVEKTYRALGKEIYSRISDGKKIEPEQDEGIKYFINKIDTAVASIKAKELEIEKIKKDYTEKARQAKNNEKPPEEEKTKTQEKKEEKPEKAEKSGSPKKASAKKTAVKKKPDSDKS